MARHRTFLLLVLVALLVASQGCSQRQTSVTPPTPPPAENLILLLPGEDAGTGRVVVSNEAGSQELDAEFTAVKVASSQTPPSGPIAVTAEEAQAIFGRALEMLPEPEITFTLHFLLGSDVLTAESVALVPELLEAVTRRASTDVSITGHTDTTGIRESNYTLGMRRAEMVSRFLIERGLDPASVTVESHGEAELLVPTADNVEEPRNRRVEVTIR